MPKRFKTPQELLDAYSNGFVGAKCDPAKVEALLAKLPHPTFATAGLLIRDSGAGKLSTPFKSVYNVSPTKPYLEKQTTGDCVSHGTRNSVDVSRAVQIDVRHTLESFVTIGATEAIYGCRGHGGEGMSCSEAAEFVHSAGGIILRKKYADLDLDFTEYDASIGTQWGSRGVPKKVIQIAQEHQVKTITQIKNINDARDALANGYAIAVCSNQGFSSTRDEKGFAKPQGHWGHCMAWIACDDTGSEPAFLVQNSWGAWNGGGHPSWGQIPDGSFMIHADIADDMLRSDGSFAFSTVNGFPPVKLPNYGFEEYL